MGYRILFDEGTKLDIGQIHYPHKIINPWTIVDFLFLVHKKKGLEPPREFKTYLRQAKQFIKENGGSRTIYLIQKASQVSIHSFGFTFLEKLNEQTYLDKTEKQLSNKKQY